MTKMKSPAVPMTMSGFCAFPSANSHDYCQTATCTCTCHGRNVATLPKPATVTAALVTAEFTRGQTVLDLDGNLYTYVSRTANGKHLIESLDSNRRSFARDGQIVLGEQVTL